MRFEEADDIAALLSEAGGELPEESEDLFNSTQCPLPPQVNQQQSTNIQPTEIDTMRHAPERARAKNHTQVFISYASKDHEWLELVQAHLKPLVRNGLVAWDDSQITSGSHWEEEIDKALTVADVAVLLVSPYYVASDFIINKELPILLDASNRGELTLLVLHLNPSRLDETGLDKIQAVNPLDEPLSELPEADQHRYMTKLSDLVAEHLRSDVSQQ